MGPNVSQLRDSIEPGSIPYGDRQGLEAGLSEVVPSGPGGGGALGGGAPPASGPAMPMEGGALQAMLGGEIDASSDLPLTDGLSIGPGAGPVESQPIGTDLEAKLRYVALNAKTPTLRAMARAALRRRVVQRRGGSSGI